MSFRCEKCTEVAQRPNRVVVERKMSQHRDGRMGSQIVREVNLCDLCAGKTPTPPIERVEQQPPSTALTTGIDFSNAVQHEEV